MTIQSLTAADRTARLEHLGYSESEASFLWLAALHGGYFLRRQVAKFLGGSDGRAVTELAQKVLALGHARTSTWRQNTQLYHLCSRPFYEALGEGDNRNRRPREWQQIKNKIMGLDFVLAHRDVQSLATEREKLDYFTGVLTIERDKLPTKHYRAATDRDFTTRYFVDKYPIFINGGAPSESGSVVSFCFVDEGMVGLSRFESYLGLYRPLFESLPAFHLIYVAASQAHFAGARTMFERFCTQNASGSHAGPEPNLEELLIYFRLRSLYERRDFDAFDRSQLIRLRDARAVFSGPQIDALYLSWRAGGDEVVRARRAENRHRPRPIHGTFSSELLRHDYGLFGDFLPR